MVARRCIPALLLSILSALLALPADAGTGSQPFIRGDTNADGSVDIGDAIATLGYLFSQGSLPSCMDAADANDDGAVDIGDAIYTLAFLFSAGPPPAPPYPAPGLDPTSGDAYLCGDPCLPAELCNGVDDDCDGLIDEVTLVAALEPARPPAAMPGRCLAAPLHPMLAIDITDPAGSVGTLPGGVLPSRAEFTHEEVDLFLPGIGTDLVFRRRYRSRHSGASGAMGHRWEHSYEIRAAVVPLGISLRTGDNREDTLIPQGDGVHYGSGGLPLLARFDGADLVVEFGNGGSWRLESALGEYRIESSTDAHGNALTFAYDPLGRLATIVDTIGRVVTLSYGANGRLASLDDGTGRVWTYLYYAPGETGGSPGDLKSATTPAIVGTPTGNDFPFGRTTVYTYSSGYAEESLNHQMLGLTDARGTVRFLHTYDDDPASPTAGALLSRIVDGGIHSYVLTCEAPGPANNDAHLRATVNDDRGAVSELYFDTRHRCVMRRDLTGFADPALPTTPTTNPPGPPLRPTDPPAFETRYEWSLDHRIERIVHPNGNETLLTYEVDLSPAAPLHLRTNLRQVVRVPGSHVPPGPFATLADSYQVAPGFGGFAGHQYRVLHTDPRGQTTTILRDAAGEALQVQHPLSGAVEDFERDPQGRLTAHVRASHSPPGSPTLRRRDQFTYHASGPGEGLIATAVVDSLGSALVTSFGYDARGNVIQVTHPSGSDESVARNVLGEPMVHLSPAIDVAGTRYETRLYHDANGNRVRVDLENRDHAGVLDTANPHLTRITEFDPFDRPSRTFAEKGSVTLPPSQLDGVGLPASEFVRTEAEHDSSGRLVRVRSGEAVNGNQPDSRIAFAYDERGLLYRRLDGEGGPDLSTDQCDYDPNANLIRIHTGLEAGARLTVRIFDGADRLVSETDPMGNVRTCEHDENGNLVRRLLHGELNDQPGGGSTNIRLEEVEWSYDALDRRVTELAHRFDPATQVPIGGGGNGTTWSWSAGGHLLAVTDDSGDTTDFDVDSAERPRLVIDAAGNEFELAYDANSNVISETHRDQDSGPPGAVTVRIWSYAHDGLDRRIASTGPLGEVRQWAHAWHGPARVIDERGNVTRLVADPLGRITRYEADLTSTGDGGGSVVGTAEQEFAYDDNGRRVAQTDPNGHTTSYEYDAIGRLTRVVRADGTDETATYDAHGQRLTEVDANGSLRTAAYDLLGRRVSVGLLAAPGVNAAATFATFSMDSAGRIRSAANDDVVVTRAFDSLGILAAETIGGLTVARAADDEGHAILLTYPSGRQIAYATDALGRVEQVSELGLTLAAYDYKGPGLMLRCVNGQHDVVYEYDLSGRPTGATGTRIIDGTVALAHDYSWDAAGNLASRSDLSPGSTLIAKVHGYDSLGRLVASTSTSPALPLDLATYQLDARGNRLFVGGLSFAGTYDQDATLPEPADAQMDQYTQTPSDSRAYTAAGELALRTPTSSGAQPVAFTYDAWGRLRSRQVGSLPPTLYVYDAFGRLARISSPAGTQRFARCGGGELAVHDATGSEKESVVRGTAGHLLALRVASPAGGSQDYRLLTDVTGSTALLIGAAGAVVERYEYLDHGRVTVRDAAGGALPSSPAGNVHLFHGHRFEPASGSHIVGGRAFLEPATGRLDDDDKSSCWIRVATWAPAEEYLLGNATSRPGAGHAHGHLDYLKQVGDPATAPTPPGSVVIPVWVHAAIAIPNLIEARKGSNESTARPKVKFPWLVSDSTAAHAAIAIPNLIEARKGSNEAAIHEVGHWLAGGSGPLRGAVAVPSLIQARRGSHTADPYGRVKVQFHWDRSPQAAPIAIPNLIEARKGSNEAAVFLRKMFIVGGSDAHGDYDCGISRASRIAGSSAEHPDFLWAPIRVSTVEADPSQLRSGDP